MFVIINLQTWVLLLDYLGIGIPTPPPSRPETPEPPEPEAVEPHQNHTGETITPGGEKVPSEPLEAREVSDKFTPTDTKNTLGASLYMSTYQMLPEEGQGHDTTGGSSTRTGILADLSGLQEAHSDVSTPASAGHSGKDQGLSVWGTEGKISVKVKLNVNSLTVTFNKPEHPLARGGVSGVMAEVKLKRGNMEISGSLGQGSVMDMTETGAYYRERCEGN